MRTTWRDVAVLYGLALLVNGAVAALIDQPGYTDSYYYFNGARFILEGHLVEPYLWNYASSTGALPVPAFGYWQPLPSYLAAAGILVFGEGAPFGSAQMIYVLVASALPAVAYAVALCVGERRHARLAGLLAVFSAFYVIYWSLPETFTPFALSAGGSLALAGAGIRRRRWWLWGLAGLCAGLAHLARADGVLVIGVIVAAGLLAPWLAPSGVVPRSPLPARRAPGTGVELSLIAVAAYALVMSLWWARNLAVFGGLQAPGGLGAMWLVEYNDLFNYPSNLTAARFFDAGMSILLRARLDALGGNLATFVAVQNLVFLAPLTIIGIWRRWRDGMPLPAVFYALALFAAMTLVFPQVGMRGGYFHSGGALLPFFYVAALLGLDDILHWLSRRRGWRFDQASRVFGGAAVVIAAVVTLYVVTSRVVGLPLGEGIAWNGQNKVYAEVGETLDRMDVAPDAYVMSNNPPGFTFFTGRGGIPLPNGDEQTLLRAARDYGVEYLLLDHNVPAGLEGLYQDGPLSPSLELIAAFGETGQPVYLYHISHDTP